MVEVVDLVMDQVVVLVVLVDQVVVEQVLDQEILTVLRERVTLVVAVELVKILEEIQEQVVQE